MNAAPSSLILNRVQAAFDRQSIMETIGARLETADAGAVSIVLPIAGHILQQHGFVHAGVVTTITDSACGFAALSLMPEDAGVLTIEFKMNLLNPALGERLIACGRVVKPGRNVMVAMGECFAEHEGQRKQVALMTASMMVVRGRDGVRD